MVSPVHFSSKSDEWATPPELFARWNLAFNFTVDVAATPETTKVPECYFTEETDGLAQSWAGHRVFCNPPYSNISEWVDKAIEETARGCHLVFLLVPARTDQAWFRKLMELDRCDLWFFRGRIKFGTGKAGAPFPSVAAIIWGTHVRELKQPTALKVVA